VRERTAQIGIQKALGARPYFILLQFVFEAVLLSVVGGAVGLLLIWVGTTIASAVSGFEIILTLKNIMIGLGISSVVGAVSGFFPAWSAAIMEPVEAIHKN
ncbi:MAG: FtsX-like permease family protein, partial [Mucinivorans sp.]